MAARNENFEGGGKREQVLVTNSLNFLIPGLSCAGSADSPSTRDALPFMTSITVFLLIGPVRDCMI